MTYPFPSDVQHLVFKWMAAGEYPSEDDILRDALRALAEEKENLQAVREAIADWRGGDEGVPLVEAFEALRGRYPS